MLKEHQAKHQIKKEIQERKKREAGAAAALLAHALVDHLNTGVAQAYVNQKKLDTETKILQTNVTQFSWQTTQWLKLIEDFNQSLKEIGDLENWSRSIETDMKTISSALEYAYKSQVG
jgi:5,10-methylene-tetrahydrofolate dehydrogenase/methenyl tetrahydrofolate cyclohydrolase